MHKKDGKSYVTKTEKHRYNMQFKRVLRASAFTALSGPPYWTRSAARYAALDSQKEAERAAAAAAKNLVTPGSVPATAPPAVAGCSVTTGATPSVASSTPPPQVAPPVAALQASAGAPPAVAGPSSSNDGQQPAVPDDTPNQSSASQEVDAATLEDNSTAWLINILDEMTIYYNYICQFNDDISAAIYLESSGLMKYIYGDEDEDYYDI